MGTSCESPDPKDIVPLVMAEVFCWAEDLPQPQTLCAQCNHMKTPSTLEMPRY